MVKDHSDSERGNLLISSKGSFICMVCVPNIIPNNYCMYASVYSVYSDSSPHFGGVQSFCSGKERYIW